MGKDDNMGLENRWADRMIVMISPDAKPQPSHLAWNISYNN